MGTGLAPVLALQVTAELCEKGLPTVLSLRQLRLKPLQPELRTCLLYVLFLPHFQKI